MHLQESRVFCNAFKQCLVIVHLAFWRSCKFVQCDFRKYSGQVEGKISVRPKSIYGEVREQYLKVMR